MVWLHELDNFCYQVRTGTGDGMSDSWDDYAEGWDSNSDAITFAAQAYRSLIDLIDISGLRILDFGCGTGLLTERMALDADRVVALDSSAKMISVLNDKGLENVETIAEILSEKLIYGNSFLYPKFDLVVASSVCAFLPEYENTLLLLKSLLKTNVILVQWDWLKSDQDSTVGFTRESINLAFAKSGIEVVAIKESFSILSNGNSMKVVMAAGKNP